MRLGGLRQRKCRADPHLQLTGPSPGKQIGRARLQLRLRERVVGQRGSRDEKRAALREHQRRKRRHRPARIAIRYKHPARAQARERALERIRPDRIVHHIHAASTGELFHRLGKLFPRVHADGIRPRAPRELGLRIRAHRRDHPRATALRDLDEQQAHATRAGMHQCGVTRLERKRIAREIVRRHPLQHEGRGHCRRNALRQPHGKRRRRQRVLRISPGRACAGHTVADLELRHARTHRRHHPRGLHAKGATICMVTHNEDYARKATRVVHLFDGRIVDDRRG